MTRVHPFRPIFVIFNHFQSVSISFNQLQSMMINFNQFGSVKSQSPPRGAGKQVPRENWQKMSKIFLTLCDEFWRFLRCAKMSTSVANIFDTFWRFLTFFDAAPFRWPLLRSAEKTQELINLSKISENSPSQRPSQSPSQRQISSQRLSVLLPLIVLPLELSPIQARLDFFNLWALRVRGHGFSGVHLWATKFVPLIVNTLVVLL